MRLSFISQTNDRRLPSDYDGDILLWDIDKTYLDTHFSSWRGLLRIPLELAVDKSSIPGSIPLLRAVRHGPGVDPAVVPLYFVSGSPTALRKTIERKMTLDGVGYDGVTFKDQWGLLRARRARDVKEQIGYKLKALLSYRSAVPSTARWILFGDDVESDAEIFQLFGEICAGLRGATLRARLSSDRVHPADIAEIEAVASKHSVSPDPVDRIFIHLSPNSDIPRFGDPRITATRSYIQTALVLASLGKIRPEAVAAVTHDLRRRSTPEFEIEHMLEDARRRLSVPQRLIDLADR